MILLEGGNLTIDGKQADHLDLKATKRSFIVPVLDKLLHNINALYQKQFKTPLWDPKLLNDKSFLSGSSLHFFNVKGISDDQFVKVKPKVGDIDTMVDREKEANLAQLLTSLQGKKFGDVTFVGFQRGNEQYSSLWEIGNPPSIKIQIDFEFVEFANGKPSDWAKFSHSSSWEDLQLRIKGVFHKFLIQSLASLTYREFLQRKLVGRGKARTEQDVPVSDNLLSFAVSSKEGGGLRAKYVPVIDPATNKPLVKDGLPVMSAAPAANYEQNLQQIFTKLFGKNINTKALARTWSFNGLLELMNQLLTPEQKNTVFQQFLQKTIGLGAQGLYKNDPNRDLEEKLVAINHAMKQLGIQKPANLDQMIDTYKKSYKMVTNEAAPDYKRKGIPHIYNPGSTVEMKDADFIHMCQEIASMGGKLDNAAVNLKVDGAGIRFGKDPYGKPFFMTSKVVEPKYIENYGDFENYSRNTSQDPERIKFAKQYDKALKTIVSSDFIKGLPNDTIVQAEMLYTPLGKKTAQGVTFVNIPYDPKKLGIEMTLVPFSVKTYSTGRERPDSNKIKQDLIRKSNTRIKIIDNKIKVNNVDVSSIVNPIAKNATALLTAVKSRGESEQKTKAREILTAARKKLSDVVINNPNLKGKDQLGNVIEGLVINLPDGTVAKVTSADMKEKMAAKQTIKPLTKKPVENNRNKPAVVTIGSFVGHKGHEQLIDRTIAKAKELGGDPYIYVSPVVGPDDPIPPEMKLQTLRKLYPQYANNIQVWQPNGTPMKKIEKELVLPENSPYNKIILLVGSDRYTGMKNWMDSLEQRMKDPVALAKYGGTQNTVDFETINVPRDEAEGGTGISFTKLRNILSDPMASDEDKIKLWTDYFDTQKLGIEWVKKLMNTAALGMKQQQIKEFIERIKPLINEATDEQKVKLAKLLETAKESLSEAKIKPETVEHNGYTFELSEKFMGTGGQRLQVIVTKEEKYIGHAIFLVITKKHLEAESVGIEQEYRGQGLATFIYDWLKSLGYTIHKSAAQTRGGAALWNKRRGEERVWETEENLDEGLKTNIAAAILSAAAMFNPMSAKASEPAGSGIGKAVTSYTQTGAINRQDKMYQLMYKWYSMEHPNSDSTMIKGMTDLAYRNWKATGKIPVEIKQGADRYAASSSSSSSSSVKEANNPAQQAAIAIAKKKEQGVKEGTVVSMNDDPKMLHKLAEIWWNGKPDQHFRAAQMLAKMGWDIQEDEDDILLRTIKGDKHISIPMDDLEKITEGDVIYPNFPNKQRDEKAKRDAEVAKSKAKYDAMVKQELDQEQKLRRYAAIWYHNDRNPQIERILDRLGYEIGEVESEDGGVFIMHKNDINGNSYVQWTAADLEGLNESHDYLLEK